MFLDSVRLLVKKPTTNFDLILNLITFLGSFLVKMLQVGCQLLHEHESDYTNKSCYLKRISYYKI